MDIEEVKIIIRSLVTSSQVSCTVRHLLRDFKNDTGIDLPLFGHNTPIEFLRSIPDTVKLAGNSNNPEVLLVQSEKSAHVSTLVEEQRRNPKLAFVNKRVVIPNSHENKNPALYNIPKLVEAVNRNPPSLPPYANWNCNTNTGRYSWCTNPHLSTCTLYCLQREANKVKYFNDLLYNATSRDYMNNYARNSQAEYSRSGYQSGYSRSGYGPNYIRSTYTSDYSRNGYPILGRHNTNNYRSYNKTMFQEQKTTSEQKNYSTVMNSTDTVAEKAELAEKEIKSGTEVAEKIDREDNNNNSHFSDKISDIDKKKLKKYIEDHSNGVTVSELLGILNISKKSSQTWKKSVTTNDIIISCSAFSVLIDNKFYKNDAIQEEVNSKKETKVTIKKSAQFFPDNKVIKINIKSNQDENESKKKLGPIFDEFVEFDEDLKMNNKTSSDPVEPSEENNYCKVNDRVQIKLSKLIKNFPNGLWCCDLREKYYETYRSPLDFKEFGCTSMIEMIFQLPKIFRAYRPGQGDWILFAASAAISEEEKKYSLVPVKSINVPNCIKSELLKLLMANDLGILIEDISQAYYKMYRKKLDYESIGFYDLKSFLESLEGEIVHLIKIENTLLVTPLKRKIAAEEPEEPVEAVAPIKPGDDLFIDLFPEDVLGPDERIIELQLENILEIGSILEVVVGEVYTPHKFYVTLKEYDQALDSLMKDLEYFFSNTSKNYTMPSPTLQPQQVCAAYYDDKEVEEKWHRAEIIKVISEKRIVVNLLDFGTMLTTRPSRLRFLPKVFGDLPVQAIHVSLAHVQPPNDAATWGTDSNKKFLDLVSAPSMFMEVLDIDYKKRQAFVNLSEKAENKDLHVAECLIVNDLATYSEEIFATHDVLQEKKKQEPKPEPTKPKTLDINVAEKSKTTQCSIGVVSPMRQDAPFVSSSANSTNPASSANYTNPASSANSTNLTQELRVPPAPVVSAAPSQPTPQPHLQPQPFPSNPPPGLDPLTLYLQMQLAYLRQQQLQEAEKQKQINKMALDILQSNPDIKKVADTDLNGALRLAYSLAQAYYGSSNANQAATDTINLMPRQMVASSVPVANQTNLAQTPSSFVNSTSGPAANYTNARPTFASSTINPVPPTAASYTGSTPAASTYRENSLQNSNITDENKEINTITNNMLPLNITDPFEKKSNFRRYVKEVKVDGRTLHLINWNNKAYFCAEQLRQNFTPFSSWSVAEKVISAKKITCDFEVIMKDSPVYLDLENYNSFKIGDYDSQTDRIRLLPLNQVIRFLFSLKVLSEGALVAFTELLEDFDHKDQYWTNP